MHNCRSRYRLLGIAVSRPVYRKLGRFVPYRFRDVRSIPVA